MKEKERPTVSPLVMLNKKGMIGFYCLMFLTIVMFYISLIMSGMNKYLYFREHLEAFRRMNNAEVLAIMRIKQQFREYREKDEKIRYQGCLIEIQYESTIAHLTISYNGLIRERELEYDDVTETISESK